MAAKTHPILSWLKYAWGLGFNGWHAENDDNLVGLGALTHLSVISRTTSLPGSPSDGDRYIVPAGDANEHQVAVRVEGAWKLYVPNDGWWTYVEDEDKRYQFVGGEWAEFVSGALSLFAKRDGEIAAWSKTGAFAAETSQAMEIEVDGSVLSIAASTSITMPGSPVAGTDYAIWCHPDGELEATDDHDTPPVADARKVGGFHYAPGGNATGQLGGDTTPTINAFSFWDLHWRPACPDPRGMTLVAGMFWADIYLLGADHHVNGTSAHNVTIADNSSKPKIPDAFGGDGSSVYDGTWWNMAEVLASHGKRPAAYHEFAALAYGVTEAQARGNDAVTTGLGTTNTGNPNTDEEFTSKWGVIQAAGVQWVWGAEFGGASPDAPVGSWDANTQGRGSTFEVDNVARFGGTWSDGANAGSRCSLWSVAPPAAGSSIGARGVCSHYRAT
jgi:hypothetical protein